MRRKIGPGQWEELGPGAATSAHRSAQSFAATARPVGHMDASEMTAVVAWSRNKGGTGTTVRLGIKR